MPRWHSGWRGMPKAELKRNADAGGGNVEWYTPPDVIEAAREAMGGIDVDPASNDMAQGWIRAGVYYTRETDGLRHPWMGSVWLNPPFKADVIRPFAEKLMLEWAQGRTTQACWLSPTNAMDTLWFHKLMARASGLCVLQGRVKFIGSDGVRSGTAWASMVLYLGEHPGRFDEAYAHMGVTWMKRGVRWA